MFYVATFVRAEITGPWAGGPGVSAHGDLAGAMNDVFAELLLLVAGMFRKN